MKTAQVSDSYGLESGDKGLNVFFFVFFWGFVIFNGIFQLCALKWDTAGQNIYWNPIFCWKEWLMSTYIYILLYLKQMGNQTEFNSNPSIDYHHHMFWMLVPKHGILVSPSGHAGQVLLMNKYKPISNQHLVCKCLVV